MMMKIMRTILPNFVRKYLVRVGVSLDIFINVLLGGHINQTFSARSWQWKKNGKPNIVWLIDLIVFWDPDHCMHSWLYWKTKKATRKFGRTHVEVVNVDAGLRSSDPS